MFERVLKRIRAFVDFEMEGLENSINAVSGYASGVLLDVGCGDKPYQTILGPHISRYVGLEYSASYADSLNEASGSADMLYDGENIPFADESVDTVLCTQVLEHVPDPDLLMREMARVLRTGGNLIVTAPFSYRLHAEPHDYWRFTRHGLERLLEGNGLRTQYVDARGGLWKVIGLAVNWHLLIKLCQLEGLAQRAGAYGYLAPACDRPRYWLLPLIVPLAVLVAVMARLLDRIDHDQSMVLGYAVVGTKGQGIQAEEK